MNRYMNVFVLYVPIYECICTIFTDVRMYLYYMYRYTDVFVLCVPIYESICTICTNIRMYLYYMYRYTNVFVLYVPIYGCICTICTDIWMYLYCMYGYMDVFVLCVLILIRTWSFRFVYSIYFPKPPQSALKPHSNYKKDLQFARTEPFHSSPLCHAGPNARSHTKRGTTCLLCTKCK